MNNKKRIKVLVVGGGAREDCLAWYIAKSKKVSQVFVVPGNGGTAFFAKNLPISPTNIPAIVKAATENEVGLVVIGPEMPLALGLVDALQEAGILAFGPTKAATRIESSKAFARWLMEKYGIPCANGKVFSDYDKAKEYLLNQQPPIVIKADGLAAGKGVTVAKTMEEALVALDNAMVKRVFDDAGDVVIIEECLYGREVSLIAFTDGKTVVPMAPACDYKRVFDNDEGPNTGGMGSYSPSEFLTPSLIKKITNTILYPTIRAMAAEGRPYKGVLYAGLMVMPDGQVKVLEFNARFGDPETQVQLPRLRTDLVDIMLALINGALRQKKIEWSADVCVGVVMASGGYPGSYKTGHPIAGLRGAGIVFHAGTKKLENGQLVTDGGRVLTVVATGKNFREARHEVYKRVCLINFQDCYFRTDIGRKPEEAEDAES